MMKRFIVVSAVFVFVLIGTSSFGSNAKDAPSPVPQSMPAASTAQADVAPSGKIVETMNAANYTYLRLENKGKKTWVAIPATKVKVGEKVSCQPGMVMNNFTSKTLNRTFDTIVFSGGIKK